MVKHKKNYRFIAGGFQCEDERLYKKYPGNQPGDERVILYVEPERISRMG